MIFLVGQRTDQEKTLGVPGLHHFWDTVSTATNHTKSPTTTFFLDEPIDSWWQGRHTVFTSFLTSTRMWANAQRHGRPAEYRWRPLFNTSQFGWRPLLECRAVTLPRCESRWNLLGCPKLANRSQPLVGRCSSYCKDMWGRYCCFSDCRYVPQLQRYSPTKLCDGAQMAIFCILYFQRATCSTFQTCILNSH